jgi:hypothetical protein
MGGDFCPPEGFHEGVYIVSMAQTLPKSAALA